jgi:hypothetical protein
MKRYGQLCDGMISFKNLLGAARGKRFKPGRQISRRTLDPQPPQHMGAQRCPRLIHALLHELTIRDGLVDDQVPDARLDIEQNPFQDLFNDRSKPSCSRATINGDPSDLTDRRIGEDQVRTLEPDELSELLNQRILQSLKNSSEVIHSQ